jgi:hypothetical protein
MRWERNEVVWGRGKERCIGRFSGGKRNLEDLDVDERIILKLILRT